MKNSLLVCVCAGAVLAAAGTWIGTFCQTVFIDRWLGRKRFDLFEQAEDFLHFFLLSFDLNGHGGFCAGKPAFCKDMSAYMSIKN